VRNTEVFEESTCHALLS